MWRCWVIGRDGKLGWTAIVIVVTLMNITAASEDQVMKECLLGSWFGWYGMKTCW